MGNFTEGSSKIQGVEADKEEDTKSAAVSQRSTSHPGRRCKEKQAKGMAVGVPRSAIISG